MPSRRPVARHQASRQLLRTLTDSPALPAFVRQLPSPVLKRLIEHVGVRDAGSLVALTTTNQLREVFEESLWQALIPGEAETLRPEKFMEWLDVLLEVGPAFAVERLMDLGDTFVVLNFSPLITVFEASVLAGHQDPPPCACVLCELSERGESFLIFGDYVVVARHEDEWESIQMALEGMQDEDAEFMQRVLARCCNAPTVLGYADDGQALLEDETFEREQKRERSGFVTPPMAARFLKSTRMAALTELSTQTRYDPISQRYFEQLAAAKHTEAEVKSAARPEIEDELDQATASPFELRALETALVDAQVIGDEKPLLLTGPADNKEAVLPLQSYLDRLLMSNPAAFTRRLGELVFLANVLMAGSWYKGARFKEDEAAQAALACANLGLDYLLAGVGTGRPADRFDVVENALENEPGVVGLFRLGWNLLQSLPVRGAEALIAALRADHVREQLLHKRWIVEEIETALCNPDILDLIEQGEFEDVGDNLLLLNLILDVRACQCLRTLISDFPRYPMQLSIGFRPPQATSSEGRHLSSMQQFNKVVGFFESLDELLKI
jgi:Family of unknown function (DUF6178)